MTTRSTTQELIKELRKRKLSVYPMNTPFKSVHKDDLIIIKNDKKKGVPPNIQGS